MIILIGLIVTVAGVALTFLCDAAGLGGLCALTGYIAGSGLAITVMGIYSAVKERWFW